MKKEIEKLLNKKLTELFIELQQKNNIISGDTTIEQEIKLDTIKEELVDCIKEILDFEISLKTAA